MTPNPRPLSAAAAIDVLGEALACEVGPLALSGTLRGLRPGRVWSRCELITFDQTRVGARLPVAIPPSATVDDSAVDNAEVVITGSFEVHRHYGPVQFVAAHIAVIDAMGHTELEAQRFMAELESLHLIEANKALDLIEAPTRVGLIAPLGGGAGGADFRQRLDTANHGFQIVHRYVPMGGPAAAAAIAGALRELPAAAVDVVVVARGGGAASELAVFDDPLVIAGICTCPIPVIVAVGHATDTTRADDVAHTSLATPTAAAGWLIDRHLAQDHRQLEQAATLRSAAATRAVAQAEEAERIAQHHVAAAQRRQRFATIAALTALVVVVLVVALAVLA